MGLGDVGDQEGVEAEDEVEEGELQRGGEGVDDADGGQPDAQIGHEEGNGASPIPARGSKIADYGFETEVKFDPRITEPHGWNRPEWTIDELIEHHFRKNGGNTVIVADKGGQTAVPKVHFKAFVRPDECKPAALCPGETFTGGRATFEIEQRNDAATERGGDDSVKETGAGAEGGESV